MGMVVSVVLCILTLVTMQQCAPSPLAPSLPRMPDMCNSLWEAGHACVIGVCVWHTQLMRGGCLQRGESPGAVFRGGGAFSAGRATKAGAYGAHLGVQYRATARAEQAVSGKTLTLLKDNARRWEGGDDDGFEQYTSLID